MSLVLRSKYQLQQQQGKSLFFLLGVTDEITTHDDASMKTKISLMFLRGDSSDELQSHLTWKPADQNTSV